MYHRYINKEFTEKYIPFEYSTIFHIHATMKLCRNAELVNLQGIKKHLQSQVYAIWHLCPQIMCAWEFRLNIPRNSCNWILKEPEPLSIV